MKKNNAWKRKRQAKRNNRLKAKHRIKKQGRSMNNLNDYDVDDSSLYGWDDGSPFYPKDNIGDKPVLKRFYLRRWVLYTLLDGWKVEE